MTNEEIKSTWFSCKLIDEHIKSCTTTYRINEKIIDGSTTVEVISTHIYENVVLDESWHNWKDNIEGDFGIDNQLIIWFKLESDRTLYKLRWG